MSLPAGKMTVGNGLDGGGRIRSKGIPVIFQDELGDRLEVSSDTKSPVILKQEKPPLEPPVYYSRERPTEVYRQKSESFREKDNSSYRDKNESYRSQPSASTALLSDIDDASPSYQPPPPIRPTPIYRQPPPYLPT